MKALSSLLVASGVAIALGCSGGSGGEIAEFAEACAKTSNLDSKVCECTAAKAKAELSPKAFAFLLATLGGDQQEISELHGKLSVQETMEAGMFMTSAPAACAAEAGS